MLGNSRGRGVVAAGLVGAVLALAAPTVHAACTDTPQPGVDWRRCLLDNRNFVDVDLAGATLRDGFFARSDLTRADFSGVDARRAKFTDATLVETHWYRRAPDRHGLHQVPISPGAVFEGADLRRARFFRADLRGADFTGARLDGTDFLKADLSGARWIDGNKVCAEGSNGQCN